MKELKEQEARSARIYKYNNGWSVVIEDKDGHEDWVFNDWNKLQSELQKALKLDK